MLSVKEHEQKSVRLSNFELLRIIALFLIVMSHFSVHSGFVFSSSVPFINKYYLQITVLGNLGVNLFVLISGYFLVDYHGTIELKAIRLWVQVLFYSVVLYLFFVALGVSRFSIVDFLKSFVPIITEKWWFATTYIILLIFSPFINVLINGLDNKGYKKILIVFLIIWVIVPTATNNLLKCNDIIWFVVLYLFGAYIKRNSKDFSKEPKYYLLRFMFLFLIYAFFIFFVDVIAINYAEISSFTLYFTDKQKILIFLMSIYLFCLFKNINITNSRIVNDISSCMFGVYLIHEHPIVRDYLWNEVLNSTNYIQYNSFIIISFGLCICVFIVCVAIEKCRQLLFRPINAIMDKKLHTFKSKGSI